MARLISCRNSTRSADLYRLDDGIGNARTTWDATIRSETAVGVGLGLNETPETTWSEHDRAVPSSATDRARPCRLCHTVPDGRHQYQSLSEDRIRIAMTLGHHGQSMAQSCASACRLCRSQLPAIAVQRA